MITKEKIWHLKQIKAERRISLHRTTGTGCDETVSLEKQPHPSTTLELQDYWNMTPDQKVQGKIQQKLNKERFESRPRKRQRPMPGEDEDPIIVTYSDEEEGEDPIIIVAGLEGDDEQKDQEVEHTREEEPLQLAGWSVYPC